MSDVQIEQPIVLDLLDTKEPALSTRSDMPKVETKPDSQPAPKEEEKAKVEAAPEEGKKPSESATEEKPEDTSADETGEGKPKPKGVQKRIDELVKQREDAERRAEAERQEKLRLLALVEKGQRPDAKPADPDPEPQRPSRADFQDPAAYEEALANYADSKAAWSAKRAVSEALAEEKRKAELNAIEQGRRAAQEAYVARTTKAAEKYPDYKAVAESPDVQVSIPVAMAILHHESGPDIAYHLGKNPEEAKRISALNPAQQLVEVGLLVAKLTAPVKADSPPPQPKAVSAAPKPIKPLESKSEPAKKSPQDMSMDEYAAYVKERDKADRRPGYRT